MEDAYPLPGTLLLSKNRSNPDFAPIQTYRLRGCATKPIQKIVLENGVELPPQPLPDKDQSFLLRILHFNDFHGQITRLKEHQNDAVLSRMVTCIEKTRNTINNDPNAEMLVLSGGDELEGSLFEQLLSDGQEPVHSSYRLYSEMGVNAAVLGNHDLDRGIRQLASSIRRDARFPILAANIITPPEFNDCIDPAALFVMNSYRIAIIGLLTQGEAILQCNDEVQVTDPLEAAQNLVPLLRPLSDAIVLLTHLGRSQCDDGHAGATVGQIGDVELAQNLPPGSVDLIIGSHTHHALNEHGLSDENLINGVPILQAGAFGEYLGDATLHFSGDMLNRPKLTNVCLINLNGLKADPLFETQKIEPLARRARKIGQRSLGVVASGCGLDRDSICSIFGAGEFELANLITDGITAQCRSNGFLVDFSMIDRAAINDGLLPDSDLHYADWFRVMPHNDCIYLYTLEGSQLAQFLSDNAYRINRSDENDTERGFAQMSSEIRYRIERGKLRFKAKVHDITFSGVPLTQLQKRRYTVASTSFFRMLCRRWERDTTSSGVSLFNIHEVPCTPTSLSLRELMVEYLLRYGGVTPEAGARLDGRIKVH
ncbi:MAG: bifunctional metallophosphatase/5'-nucleotidase [Anaerolineae bacterium]|nr:bifunctional metallophosphatase/5'-nucleotidase [Anaerolineae bacterium]